MIKLWPRRGTSAELETHDPDAIDLPPNMRWKIAKDLDGDNRLKLQRRCWRGWKTERYRYWGNHVDLRTVVPNEKRVLWRNYCSDRAIKEENRAYAREI